MIIKAKTKLIFDTEWLDRLKFAKHSDYDLVDSVDAISVKSETGKVYDFYRTETLERPENFKMTQLYYKVPQVKKIMDVFQIPSTRVRIHKQDPCKSTRMHTDDNNIAAKTKDDYRVRFFTALTSSVDFYYYFKHKGILQTLQIEQGETIMFDPDLVMHGMENKSKTKTRYSLIQIVKPYPMDEWLTDFLYAEKEINCK